MLGEVEGESWRVIVGENASEEKSRVSVRWRLYELVGSGGPCGAGSTHTESSHCPSNPILDGKIRMLNDNDDDDESFLKMGKNVFFLIFYSQHSIVNS